MDRVSLRGLVFSQDERTGVLLVNTTSVRPELVNIGIIDLLLFLALADDTLGLALFPLDCSKHF